MRLRLTLSMQYLQKRGQFTRLPETSTTHAIIKVRLLKRIYRLARVTYVMHKHMDGLYN